jgi:hypothetical protein
MTPELNVDYDLRFEALSWPGRGIAEGETHKLPAGSYYFSVAYYDGSGVFNMRLSGLDVFGIHNLNSGLNYTTIQEAIDANETLSNDTLLVNYGMYREHILMYKSLSLISGGFSYPHSHDDPDKAIIDGGNISDTILVTADNVVVNGFTVTGRNNGFTISSSSNDLLENNVISSTGLRGIEVNSYCFNVTMKKNLIMDAGWEGLVLQDSNCSFVEGNIILESGFLASDRSVGVDIIRTNNTIIYENSLMMNNIGVYVMNMSRGGAIYWNRFYYNVQHQAFVEPQTIESFTWDEGYPGGGNYWSDYMGTDDFSGMYQNATGYDYLGDTPYIIDANNKDNYPLVVPFSSSAISDRTDLLANLTSLNVNYTNLQSSYNQLNSTFNNLTLDYTSLQSLYNQLNSTYSNQQSDLATVRYTMYALVGTTVILIATTVFFAAKKRKT